MIGLFVHRFKVLAICRYVSPQHTHAYTHILHYTHLKPFAMFLVLSNHVKIKGNKLFFYDTMWDGSRKITYVSV